MDYKDRVAEVKKIFADNDMKEEDFWNLVRRADWPHRGYDEPKLEFLKTLSPETGIKFRQVADKLWGVIDRFIGSGRNPARGGDDSHSDLIFHIIGSGKITFYDCLKNYAEIDELGDSGKYEESFGYCVPYKDDWNDPQKEIASLEKSLKRENERVAGVKHKYFHQIRSDIMEALEEMEGIDIADLYNSICDEQIEYVEDSVWKVVENA